jgi:hypothetical protein
MRFKSMLLATALTLALCLLALGFETKAAEFKRVPQANGPDIVGISGPINLGDNEKFIAITKNLADATIVLDSPGGVVNAAFRIGAVTYIKKYETRVNAGAVCNSACPFIWLAGAYRDLDETARLGFHTIYRKETGKRDDDSNFGLMFYLMFVGTPGEIVKPI